MYYIIICAHISAASEKEPTIISIKQKSKSMILDGQKVSKEKCQVRNLSTHLQDKDKQKATKAGEVKGNS